MGFFDKAKSFFGGHGVKVEITRLERQDPSTVTFPIGDSVFKGNWRVVTEKPCTVLSHTHELVVKKTFADGREEELVVGEDTHDNNTDILGHPLKWPYDLQAGGAAEDSFLIDDIDLPKALRRLGYANPEDAITDTNVEVFFRATADVKGSPFDPDATAKVRLIP
ncbi:MAG: hypothetical protein R3A79_02475 [Nannocystaceae bacterium]